MWIAPGRAGANMQYTHWNDGRIAGRPGCDSTRAIRWYAFCASASPRL